jgi:hypothetical protein
VDLNKKVVGCEAKEITHVTSWFGYYKGLVNEEALECMYIYISPKELIGKNSHLTLPDLNLRDRPTPIASFGMTAKGTASADFLAGKALFAGVE